jgi:hypothetical protein
MEEQEEKGTRTCSENRFNVVIAQVRAQVVVQRLMVAAWNERDETKSQ